MGIGTLHAWRILIFEFRVLDLPAFAESPILKAGMNAKRVSAIASGACPP